MSGEAGSGLVVLTMGRGVVAGGNALGRLPDGRVVLVEGALPGETVEVVIVSSRRDHARGRVEAVHQAAAERIPARCPHVAEGCGGCGWAHVEPDAQLDMAGRIIIDALTRIGRVRDLPVLLPARRVATSGYRTTIAMAVAADGTLAYHRRHAGDLVTVGDCPVAHPRVSELIGSVAAPGWGSVTLRAGIAGGERIVVIDPAARSAARRSGRAGRSGGRPGASAPALRGVRAPADAVIVSPGKNAYLHEDVGGLRWRISARSFFQSGPEGGELLVAAVDRAVGDALDAGGHVVDAYAGVGLLGGVIAQRRGARLTAVESHRVAVADAVANLADLDATIVHDEVGRWVPRPADVVIADPARPGLGRPGVGTAVATKASRIVLVSCDPASLGRDVALLADAGYRLVTVEVVGMFPDTVHVETVSRFDASGGAR